MTESRLESLLDETRDALLAGDLSRLGALADRTEQALAASSPAGLAEPGRLRDLSRRNEALLAAAIRGVKAARRRAVEVAGHGRFATYDAQGKRADMGAPAAALVRRA